MALGDHLTSRVLQLLAAIRETGSLTQAAQRLHIVPSAASRRVQACEAALGVVLLERSARGVTLTPAGLAVVRHADRVNRDLEALAGEFDDLARGVRGRVSLSAAASAIAQHLPEDLGHFLRRRPDIRVDLQEHVSATVAERLRARETDVGILVAETAELPGLNLLPYRHESLVVILPATHPLVHRSWLAFRDLLDEDWVGLRAGTSLAALLSRQAAAHGRTLRTRIEVYAMESVCRMVQNGLGIAIMPQKALGPGARYPGVTAVALREPWAGRTLYVASNADVEPEPAARALVQALASSLTTTNPSNNDPSASAFCALSVSTPQGDTR